MGAPNAYAAANYVDSDTSISDWLFTPVVILNALAGKPIPVYGAGENIRDWLYVEDHADALLTVLQRGAIGRSYNIGGENEARNIDLVRMICAILDTKRPKSAPYAEQITFVTDRPGHDRRYALDTRKLRQELGWQPEVSLEEGLRETVGWYVKNLSGQERSASVFP